MSNFAADAHDIAVALGEESTAVLPVPRGDVPDYDARMVYEIAQGLENPAGIAERYGISPEVWELFTKHKPFLMAVARYRQEFKDSGYTFRVKAHLQAESLLQTAYIMAQSAATPAPVRADLIKWTAKVAGLEPDSRDAGSHSNPSGFQININLGPGKGVTVDGRALPVTQLVQPPL